MADMYRCPEWQTCKESCPYKWVHKKSKGCLGHKNDKVMCPPCIPSPLPSEPAPQPCCPEPSSNYNCPTCDYKERMLMADKKHCTFKGSCQYMTTSTVPYCKASHYCQFQDEYCIPSPSSSEQINLLIGHKIGCKDKTCKGCLNSKPQPLEEAGCGIITASGEKCSSKGLFLCDTCTEKLLSELQLLRKQAIAASQQARTQSMREALKLGIVALKQLEKYDALAETEGFALTAMERAIALKGGK